MKSTAARKKDALRVAQGLFESKVSVERPPTVTQKSTYNTTRSCSAAPRTRTKKAMSPQMKDRAISARLPVQPLWKPFTGEKSLSKKKTATDVTKFGYSEMATDTSGDVKEVSSCDEKTRLPKGVESFEPWICEEYLEQWTGVKTDPNCFVLLPCGLDEIYVEYLPPLQNPDELLLEREVQKYIAPKILHNYNYLENENLYQCNHKSRTLSRLDQSDTPPRLRTSEIIKQEIEDLEKLLQGQGNPNSSSIITRYQHEITTLKQMVFETLREYNIEEKTLDEEKPEEPVIQGDLFEFIARHDEVIAAIKEKRDACIRELARLEKEIQGR